MEENVNVAVRIKPTRTQDLSGKCLDVISRKPPVLIILEKSQTFHFDNIFPNEVTQEEVYNATVKNLVSRVKAGYSCTVFAYGQTGTGKTYTIGTNLNSSKYEAGLISRTLADLMDNGNDSATDVQIEISFLEVYNAKVYDLLTEEKIKIPLSIQDFSVQCRKVKISTVGEGLLYLYEGSKKRRFGETKQNLSSSRSHAIFSIYYSSKSSQLEIYSKINLVDLAGSESIRKTGNLGSSLSELININKGLLCIGQVMKALQTNASYIPYRQSVITTILKDSLNKRNFISLIACIKSDMEDSTETLQTLEFARRVKRMKSKPEINEIVSKYKRLNSSFLNNRRITPMKRSNQFMYETPLTKRQKKQSSCRELSMSGSLIELSPLLSSSRVLMKQVKHTMTFSPLMRKLDSFQTEIMTQIQQTIERSIKKSPNVKPLVEHKNKEYIQTCKRLNWTLSNHDESIELIKSPKNNSIRNEIEDLIPDCKKDETVSENDAKVDNADFSFKVPTIKVKNSAKNFVPATTRRSVRILEKSSINLGIKTSQRRQSSRILNRVSNFQNSDNLNASVQTTIHAKQRRTSVQKKKADRPKTSRTKPSSTNRSKVVLDILNNGSLRELEALHGIGRKTAEKFLLYREINGKFKNILDLSNVPYFSKKVEKFMAENYLV